MLEKTEKIFVSNNKSELTRTISIIHFNDVYNIESRNQEPVGGAVRFISAVEHLIKQNQDTLVFFSGDALGPSNSNFLIKNEVLTVEKIMKKLYVVLSEYDR